MFKRVGMFTIALAAALTFFKPATASAQGVYYNGGYYVQTYREPCRDNRWDRDRREDFYRAQEFREDRREDRREDWRRHERQERFERNNYDRERFEARPWRGDR